MRFILIAALAALSGGCAQNAAQDPWEPSESYKAAFFDYRNCVATNTARLMTSRSTAMEIAQAAVGACASPEGTYRQEIRGMYREMTNDIRLAEKRANESFQEGRQRMIDLAVQMVVEGRMGQ